MQCFDIIEKINEIIDGGGYDENILADIIELLEIEGWRD